MRKSTKTIIKVVAIIIGVLLLIPFTFIAYFFYSVIINDLKSHCHYYIPELELYIYTKENLGDNSFTVYFSKDEHFESDYIKYSPTISNDLYMLYSPNTGFYIIDSYIEDIKTKNFSIHKLERPTKDEWISFFTHLPDSYYYNPISPKPIEVYMKDSTFLESPKYLICTSLDNNLKIRKDTGELVTINAKF